MKISQEIVGFITSCVELLPILVVIGGGRPQLFPHHIDQGVKIQISDVRVHCIVCRNSFLYRYREGYLYAIIMIYLPVKF